MRIQFTPEERAMARRAAHARYRAAHPERVHAAAARYRAAHPESVQAYNAAWRAAHRETKRAYDAAWRATHPEYRAVYDAAHREKSRERTHHWRARLRAAFIAPVDAIAIYGRDQGRCHICGRKVKPKDASMDHLIPLSLGGTHEPVNVRLAHRKCNMKRQHRGPAQLIMVLP